MKKAAPGRGGLRQEVRCKDKSEFASTLAIVMPG